MIPGGIPDHHWSYILNKIEAGSFCLFTGAGFSLGAINIAGEKIPTVQKLKEMIWELVFPGEPIDAESSLQNIYQLALSKRESQLATLMTRELSVDRTKIPEYYKTIFGMPWSKIYTLNIDNLAASSSTQFGFRRRIIEISGQSVESHPDYSRRQEGALFQYHINGNLTDIPNKVTFSMKQYSARLAFPDAIYSNLSADLLTNPFVFIGTKLEEPSFWQYIEIRKAKGKRGIKELRPKSFLITPSIDRGRQLMLEEYNIYWLPLDTEQFGKIIESEAQQQCETGLVTLEMYSSSMNNLYKIQSIDQLAITPHENTDYLLGQEPVWSDFQNERSIKREVDGQIEEKVNASLGVPNKGLIVITGTAASGKSSSLMRVGLSLSSNLGKRVIWIDKDSRVDSRTLIHYLEDVNNKIDAIGIDDADMFGDRLSTLILDIYKSKASPLIMVGIRSGRIDSHLNKTILKGIPYTEIEMPPMVDTDIEALIDLLEKEGRLGVLKGKPRSEQVDIFRRKSGRQLLVAMIEATSNKRFEEKISSEYRELDDTKKFIYACIAVTSALRFNLSKDEILISINDYSNEALQAINELVSRKLLYPGDAPNTFRARHRRIAEVLLETLREDGHIKTIMGNLVFLAASKVSPTLDRQSKPWRLLISLISHGFLLKFLGVQNSREVYEGIQDVLNWDHHYWLQRGSLEVEQGKLDLAENFISQSKGINPDDPLVLTEYAYLQYKKANENPGGFNASDFAKEAQDILIGLMSNRGYKDSYPYHIYGSQGLSWSRRGIGNIDKRIEFLKRLDEQMKIAKTKYPRREDIVQLEADVYNEYLKVASGAINRTNGK